MAGSVVLLDEGARLVVVVVVDVVVVASVVVVSVRLGGRAWSSGSVVVVSYGSVVDEPPSGP